MSLWQIIQRLWPFVRPYRPLVLATLALTFVGSLAAQVNPFALRYTVDTVQHLLDSGRGLAQGWHLLLWVSAILLGKEILNAGITFGQKYFGEKIRISVSGYKRPNKKLIDFKQIVDSYTPKKPPKNLALTRCQPGQLFAPC